MSFCLGSKYQWLTMLNSFMKLPKRENLIGPILHYPPHLSLPSLNTGCLSMGQVPIPDPISYMTAVARLLGHQCTRKCPGPQQREMGVRPTCFLLKRLWMGLEVGTKTRLSKSKFLEKEAVSLISYLHNVLVLFLNKEIYVK